MRYDPDERDAMIGATKHNYIIGEWSRVRCEPVLRACGLSATEIEEFFREHQDAAFENFKARAKNERPVK